MDQALNKAISCAKDFPDGCKDCPDYEEVYSALDAGLTGCFGLYSGPTYTLKKCRRFNWKSYGKA